MSLFRENEFFLLLRAGVAGFQKHSPHPHKERRSLTTANLATIASHFFLHWSHWHPRLYDCLLQNPNTLRQSISWHRFKQNQIILGVSIESFLAFAFVSTASSAVAGFFGHRTKRAVVFCLIGVANFTKFTHHIPPIRGNGFHECF